MGCFFFKSKSAFRQRLNFAGNVWAESTWFIPRLSLLAPRRYRCLPAPHSLGGVNSPPGQQQAGPWPYLGISAGPGNPARMDSPSSLKNRWRARTAPTSPHRKPGSTGWSTLWKKKKKKEAKISFFEQGGAAIPPRPGPSQQPWPSPFHRWSQGGFPCEGTGGWDLLLYTQKNILWEKFGCKFVQFYKDFRSSWCLAQII